MDKQRIKNSRYKLKVADKQWALMLLKKSKQTVTIFKHKNSKETINNNPTVEKQENENNK